MPHPLNRQRSVFRCLLDCFHERFLGSFPGGCHQCTVSSIHVGNALSQLGQSETRETEEADCGSGGPGQGDEAADAVSMAVTRQS